MTNAGTVRVMWSNGHVDTADSWNDLLKVVRESQVAPIGRLAFRRELAHRAWVWSNFRLDVMAPAQVLFAQMEQAHMLKIIHDDTKGR